MDITTNIEKLKSFIDAEDILRFQADVKRIKAELKSFKEETKQALEKTAEGDQEKVEVDNASEPKVAELEAETETTELVLPAISEAEIEELEKLIEAYTQKKDALLKEIRETEKNNLDAKKKVLEDFRDLIQNEENIGKAFERIKQIRDDWKAIGNVARDQYHDIQNEYSKLSETFNYNIGIYKELKENDLKKNFSLKNQIVHEIVALKDEKNIRRLENELARLRNDWDEIGGTYKDKWEIIKAKYWEAVRACYDKINAHYEDQRKIQADNLAAKKALLPKLEEIAKDTPQNVKDWKTATDQVLAVQKEWKAIGFSSKKETQEVWEKFRAICNDFFDRKQAYFEKKKGKDSVNRDKKQALIDKALKLKDSKDWRNTTLELIALQKEWKKIGHAGPHAEHKLWKTFRGACDDFFNAKDSHLKELESVFSENVEKKEAFIKTIDTIELPNSEEEALNKIKEIGEEFAALGDIPSSEGKRISAAYNKALQNKVNELSIEDKEKSGLLFKAKVLGMKDAGNDKGIGDLRRDLQKSKRKLEDNINQQETNLGFFNISKGAEGLLADVKSKIEKDKNEIARIQEKLKIINILTR